MDRRRFLLTSLAGALAGPLATEAQCKNLVFEYRSAEGHQERLAELASELVSARPDVLVAGAGTLAPLALKAATKTIPIVFTSVGDPVGAGIVPNIARPGGNITGLTGQSAEVAARRLQLLREIVPDSQVIAVLVNAATLSPCWLSRKRGELPSLRTSASRSSS